MPGFPAAEVISAQHRGYAPGRFAVRCPHCSQIHSHRWQGNHVSFDASAPCSSGASIRMYHVDLTAVLTRDDNAMDQHVNNWEE
jgi:hypothetical protein